MFIEFINQYGMQLLYALVTAVFGAIGILVKNLYEKYVNTKVKREIAKTAVRGVEQIYKDLHGDEKLDAALEAAAQMLQSHGIAVTDLELRMLIEAAVNEMNKAMDSAETAE